MQANQVFDHLQFTYLLDRKSWSGNLSKKELIQTMSVDQAFRKMIRREVETQLRPLQHAVTELGVLRALAERLQPIANFLGGAPFGASLALRRRPGRPPGSMIAQGRSFAPGGLRPRRPFAFTDPGGRPGLRRSASEAPKGAPPRKFAMGCKRSAKARRTPSSVTACWSGRSCVSTSRRIIFRNA